MSATSSFCPAELAGGWDYLPIPGARDWRRLEGVKIEGTNPGENGREALEGAFLLSSSWDGAVKSSIEFGKPRGARIPIVAKMVVDFGGFAKDDADPALVVEVNTDAVFNGLRVHRDLAKDVSAAKKLVGELLDLAAFEEPVDDGKSSFFAPLLTDAERSHESVVAAAEVEANKPKPPPLPEREKLARGLWLVPVPAPPAKPVVKTMRAPVPGLAKGPLRRTRVPFYPIGTNHAAPHPYLRGGIRSSSTSPSSAMLDET